MLLANAPLLHLVALQTIALGVRSAWREALVERGIADVIVSTVFVVISAQFWNQ